MCVCITGSPYHKGWQVQNLQGGLTWHRFKTQESQRFSSVWSTGYHWFKCYSHPKIPTSWHIKLLIPRVNTLWMKTLSTEGWSQWTDSSSCPAPQQTSLKPLLHHWVFLHCACTSVELSLVSHLLALPPSLTCSPFPPFCFARIVPPNKVLTHKAFALGSIF